MATQDDEDQALSRVPTSQFDKKSQNIIEQKALTCVLCQFVLNLAVQVTCGARFCSSCLTGLLDSGEPGICPQCEKDSPEDSHHLYKDQAQPDNFCRNQIRKLQLRCCNFRAGCDWTGEFSYTKAYKSHVEECKFGKLIKCNCGEEIPEAVLKSHQEQDCARRQPSSGDSDHQSSISLPVTGATGFSGSVAYDTMMNKLKANTNLISVLFTEIKTCSSQIVTNQEDTKRDLDNLRQKLAVLENLVTGLQGKIPRLEAYMNNMPLSSVSGQLTWCIDNVEQKRTDARNGINQALYSTPFSTSEAGYKMCARLYLNGDGIGKDTHMSLFFVLMKGRYDAILPWPFSRRVTLSLLDQSGNGTHVQEKFRPDPNSTSFQKPKSEMNIATGCPRFISHEDLNRRRQMYIKEGNMFIQIIVE